MNPVGLCVALSLCCFASVSLASAEDAADPQESLKTAIPAAIKLLEDQDFETFLEKYVPPDDLEQITKKMSLAEFAENFGNGNKVPRLLKVLEAVKDSEPMLESDGKKAVYELKEPVGSKKSITFVKIDKLWYLQN